jgi:DNA topoisomerase VI subunit B
MAKQQKLIAEELAEKQRSVSIAEFFERNRHLLGFDNPRKAILTVVKEAVDNALDACEEAKVLPEISVEIIEMAESRYRVVIEDNGPGIVEKQIPNIFAKLLYGSKFHTMKQQRGQQGIGISAAVLYAQLTTGKPVKITSSIGKGKPAHYYELRINTQNNKPEIIVNKEVAWKKDHGTKVQLEIEAIYMKGQQSVDTYIKQTAIVNPHATIIYTTPKAEQFIFARVANKLPKEAAEIKPHPYGVEIGIMMKMLAATKARTMQSFLTNEFARVGAGTAKEICEKASIRPATKPETLTHAQVEKLMHAIKHTKIISPSTDCLSPIGSDLLEKGMKKEINAEFYASITRNPSVYRGIPFVVEAAVAYGGNQKGDRAMDLLRFGNRVPLLYQQRAGAIYKAVVQSNWRNYGLSQSSGQLPIGPFTLVVHIASVWPPFTSEAKEAIANYPEIIKEVKLAIQEVGRKLSSYVRKKKRVQEEGKKRSYIQKFIPHVAKALKDILGLKKIDEDNVESILKDLLEEKRGKLKKVEHENLEYDEEFAKIGREEND